MSNSPTDRSSVGSEDSMKGSGERGSNQPGRSRSTENAAESSNGTIPTFPEPRTSSGVTAFSSKDHGADAGGLAPTLRSMNYDKSWENGGGQVAVAIGVESPEASPTTLSAQLTLSVEDSLAKTSRWLDAVLAWLESEAGSGSSSVACLLNSVPVGWSSRTSLASSRLVDVLTADRRPRPAKRNSKTTMPLLDGRAQTIVEETSRYSFQGWQNSGTGGPTEFLTLNTSEFPSDVVASSLSEVLETRPVPPKFFLSPKAATGILRRAKRRGKELPAALREALQAVAAMERSRELIA